MVLSYYLWWKKRLEGACTQRTWMKTFLGTEVNTRREHDAQANLTQQFRVKDSTPVQDELPEYFVQVTAPDKFASNINSADLVDQQIQGADQSQAQQEPTVGDDLSQQGNVGSSHTSPEKTTTSHVFTRSQTRRFRESTPQLDGNDEVEDSENCDA